MYVIGYKTDDNFIQICKSSLNSLKIFFINLLRQDIVRYTFSSKNVIELQLYNRIVYGKLLFEKGTSSILKYDLIVKQYKKNDTNINDWILSKNNLLNLLKVQSSKIIISEDQYYRIIEASFNDWKNESVIDLENIMLKYLHYIIELRHKYNLDSINERIKNVIYDNDISLHNYNYTNKYHIQKLLKLRFFHSFVKGNIMHIHNYGKIDFDALIKLSMNDIYDFIYNLIELETILISSVSNDSIQNGKMYCKTINIIDLKGIPLSVLIKPSYVNLIKEIMVIYINNGINLLEKLYIINTPKTFSLIWKLVKPLIPQDTLERITLSGRPLKEELIEHIGRDHLPLEYGGRCDCIENNCYDDYQYINKFKKVYMSIATNQIEVFTYNYVQTFINHALASVLNYIII